MNKAVNVIENVNVSSNTNYNNNDNVMSDKYALSRRVERTADLLLEKLHLKSDSRAFMCKVAYRLSEARIWDNLEQAQKGRNPVGLFIHLCKRDGV